MARYYFDTSALVKRYHLEVGSTDVDRILTEAGSEFFIARLAAVEMLSSFAGKVRTGVFLAVITTRFVAASSPMSKSDSSDRFACSTHTSNLPES